MSDIGAVPTGHPLHALHARPGLSFPFGPLAVAGAAIAGGAGLWVGIGAEETTGAAGGRLLVQDGTTIGNARTLMPYTFSAGQSRSDMWPSRGVLFTAGMFVQTTVGSIGGNIVVVLITRDELAYVLRTMQGFGE